MPDAQLPLTFDASPVPQPGPVQHLRDEIARAWRLPLGQRVEVFFHHHQLDAISGVLELVVAPDFPWDPREPLRLRIAGVAFSSRDIEHWKLL